MQQQHADEDSTALPSPIPNNSTTESSAKNLEPPPNSIANAKIDPRLSIHNFIEDKYSHYFREYTLLIEYKHLPNHVPSGVYVLPSLDSLFVWHGVIFVRQGLYRKGIFKFAIHVPENYPEAPPSFRFFTPIFHPLVHPSGLLDLKRAFPEWTPYKDQIWSVLVYVKKLFYDIPLDNPLNPEAAHLYQTNPEEFQTKVGECTNNSIKAMYINAEDSVRFTEWDAARFRPLLNSILKREEEEEQGGLLAKVSKGVSKIIRSWED